MAFTIFICFIIGLRIGELMVARRNERWLLQHGAVEYGKSHYPFMVGMHTLFILSMIIEYYLRGTGSCNIPLFIIFFLLILLKAWVITSLGHFWNTKIYRVPNFPLIRKGPYKYIKHPNYLIVIAEVAIIPLIFYLWYTAIIFSLMNIFMLRVRVKEENKALAL